MAERAASPTEHAPVVDEQGLAQRTVFDSVVSNSVLFKGGPCRGYECPCAGSNKSSIDLIKMVVDHLTGVSCCHLAFESDIQHVPETCFGVHTT